MSLDCEECGSPKTLKRVIIEWLANHKREKHYKKYLRTYRLNTTLQQRYEEDKRLLVDLSTSYQELASCYQSMQESIGAIRNIYSEMDKRVKTMKVR